jgi:hypothetical protein
MIENVAWPNSIFNKNRDSPDDTRMSPARRDSFDPDQFRRPGTWDNAFGLSTVIISFRWFDRMRRKKIN